jgi:leucyl aminopeptidase
MITALLDLDCFIESADNAVAIVPVLSSDLEKWLAQETDFIRNWLSATEFKAKPGQIACIPTTSGELNQIIVGIDPSDLFTSLGSLPKQLPVGSYYFTGDIAKQLLSYHVWALGSYVYRKSKKLDRVKAKLIVSHLGSEKAVMEACYLTRTLINMPAEDLSPMVLAEYANALAIHHEANCYVISGENLCDENFPLIYAVGRASSRKPAFIELNWGDSTHPCVTLIGKGVCFDTGGLDLKPADGMRFMKKDMGGAAHVLGLAHAIMANRLSICLRVLIPAVDNAIGGNAYRPGDIFVSRKGLSVEIGDTDAEGRLILADALAYACEGNKPELLVDFATLTGAARVAVGAEIAAYFTNDVLLAQAINQVADEVSDPVWQLPLYQGYRKSLDSTIADLNNIGSERLAGGTTAALFLECFIEKFIPWIHFDIMAFNAKARPGHPEGGEAMGLRALYTYLSKCYPVQNLGKLSGGK